MEGIKTKLRNLVRDEEGLELSEYAVAGALIVVGTIAAFKYLAASITGGINHIGNCISGTGTC